MATKAKCGRYGLVDKHHILLQSGFPKSKQTIYLCPNCHRDFHDLLVLDNLKNPDPQFHRAFFFAWLTGVIGCLALVFWWFSG